MAGTNNKNHVMAHQLYRHFDEEGRLLYVGIALCSIERLKQHKASAPWFGRIAAISILHFSDIAQARAAEAEAIRAERPIFNKQGVAVQQPAVTNIPAALLGYLERHDLTQAAFANSLKASPGLIWQWLKGRTRITPEWAVKIERRTKGEVSRADLRPDLWERAA